MKRVNKRIASYKEAVQWAAEYDEKLTASDFKRAVQVIHEDGTTMFYNDAFAVETKEFVGIFTEHFGHKVYHREDVQVREYVRVYD